MPESSIYAADSGCDDICEFSSLPSERMFDLCSVSHCQFLLYRAFGSLSARVSINDIDISFTRLIPVFHHIGLRSGPAFKMASSTAGWKFNQIGIRVSDLEKSLFFYQAVLGMKELARMELDTLIIVLVGYPVASEAGGNAMGPFNREGVLELIWNKVGRADSWDLLTYSSGHGLQTEKSGIPSPSLREITPCVQDLLTPTIIVQNSKKPLSNSEEHPEFGLIKLCLTVPDLAACMARLKEYNVPVIKQPGEDEGMDAVARAIGTESPAKGQNTALWQAVKGIGFVADPDAYVVELVQY